MIETPHNARAALKKAGSSGLTVDELAAALGLSPAGAYQVLKKFCAHSLARRERDTLPARPVSQRKYRYFIDGTEDQFKAQYGETTSHAPATSASSRCRDIWQFASGATA